MIISKAEFYEGLKNPSSYKSHMQWLRLIKEKERGIQSKCRQCSGLCKVLDSPNSMFTCFDFESKETL